MSSACGWFFLYAVMRFLIDSRTGADMSFVGDVWAVTAVALVHQLLSTPACRIPSSKAGQR